MTARLLHPISIFSLALAVGLTTAGSASAWTLLDNFAIADGTDLTTPVPEPAAFALAFGLASSLILLLRSRR